MTKEMVIKGREKLVEKDNNEKDQQSYARNRANTPLYSMNSNVDILKDVPLDEPQRLR